MTGRFGGVDVDLTLTNTDTVTWFVRNPVCKHLSLLTDYRGHFDGRPDHRRRRPVRIRIRGLPEPLPAALHTVAAIALKAPLDLSHQIISLTPTTRYS